jgi:hypothetical protein
MCSTSDVRTLLLRVCVCVVTLVVQADSFTSLIWASEKGHSHVVSTLLQRGASVNELHVRRAHMRYNGAHAFPMRPSPVRCPHPFSGPHTQRALFVTMVALCRLTRARH